MVHYHRRRFSVVDESDEDDKFVGRYDDEDD